MIGMSLIIILSLLLLGSISGFLAGLLGVGGGMIMVPFLTAMLSRTGVDAGLAIKMAIATSMAAIMFTSLSSVRAHHRRGAVRWDIVRQIAPGIVIGSLIGSLGIFAMVKGSYLGLFFGVFVAFSATQILLNKKPTASRQMPGPVGQLTAGGVIGLISGLVGAGGGFMSVPFMLWCNVAIHAAVATSAALGFPIAVANVVGYVLAGVGLDGLPSGSFGYIWLPALAFIVAMSVLTAPLGAKAAHSLPVASLKRVFACILYMLAIYMFWKGWSGG